MFEDIFSLPISLNILIPTITASIIATLVPYSWNKHKENFQHKLKIIEEQNLIAKNLHAPLRSFYNLMNWKYRTPVLENKQIVWKMRDEPLDDKKHLDIDVGTIAVEFNKTNNDILKNSTNRQNGYLKLYGTREMNPIINQQSELLAENERLLFELSYDPEKIQLKENNLKTIGLNFSEIDSLQHEIFVVYMKRFRKKYWFTRRIQDIKNIRE